MICLNSGPSHRIAESVCGDEDVIDNLLQTIRFEMQRSVSTVTVVSGEPQYDTVSDSVSADSCETVLPSLKGMQKFLQRTEFLVMQLHEGEIKFESE